MFLCLHFGSNIQTQRHMSCGLWPPLACAQQVVTNDLIVNLSWGGAFLQGTESLFVTTGSWDTVTRISTLKDVHAWMHTCTHGRTHTYLQAHLATVAHAVPHGTNVKSEQWHVKMKEECQSKEYLGMKWFVGQLRLGHWVIVRSLATPAIFPNGQLILRPSLLTIQGWMLGIVGFFPVCGCFLEHAQLKSDARKPSQQATLTWFTRDGGC